MKNKTILLLIFSFPAIFSLKQAFGAEEEYLLAQRCVRLQEKDCAFMNYASLLRDNPQSKYRQEALFATAEYYFLVHDYSDAITALTRFLEVYPASELKPFALIYLLKISQNYGQDRLAKDIEKQIINLRRVILSFKEAQEYGIKSPLGLNYKLIYYIDRVEFYSNGKLQAQIFN